MGKDLPKPKDVKEAVSVIKHVTSIPDETWEKFSAIRREKNNKVLDECRDLIIELSSRGCKPRCEQYALFECCDKNMVSVEIISTNFVVVTEALLES